MVLHRLIISNLIEHAWLLVIPEKYAYHMVYAMIWS